MGQRFTIQFDPDAAKEYDNLDGSMTSLVDKAISELQERADEVGKPLGNKRNQKLVGCKEIKLRDAGIRIVFKVTNDKVDVLLIVHVIAILGRDKDQVFKIAARRLAKDTQEVYPVIRKIEPKKKKP